MKLDRSDWKTISRVMLSIVATSLQSKNLSSGPFNTQRLVETIRKNLGELTDQEQGFVRLLMM